MRRQCDVALSELARMSRHLAISDFSVCANLLEKPELMNSKKSLKNHFPCSENIKKAKGKKHYELNERSAFLCNDRFV